MRTKNHEPTAEQRRWMGKVAGLGSLIGYGKTEIHHPIGKAARIKGVGNIGNWFVICITRDHHLILHAQGRKAFEKVTGHSEKELFEKTCSRMEKLPFSQEIYNEIMKYHK